MTLSVSRNLKKPSLSLSETSPKSALPATQHLGGTLSRVTPLGEAEDRFIHNHGGYPEAPHSKPYKSKRFLDAEESSVCIESNFASLGRLANALCHVQGALAAWCDPARSSDDSSNPSTPQAVTDLYNLSNHLTAHIARLTFKAKNEVVMDRCRRFFKAFKSDISAFNVS